MARAKGNGTRGDDGPARAPAGGRPGAPRVARVFLGLRAEGDDAAAHPRDARGVGGAPLARAARWLLSRFGSDMGAVVVALPGARAGRLLEAHLAERAAPDLVPPRFTTVGHLPDVLLPALGEVAGSTERAVAWALALRDLGDERLRPLLPHPPTPDDLPGLLALGAELRALHAELLAERRDFADVLAAVTRMARGDDAHEGPRPGAGEVERWRTLAEAQEAYRTRLARARRLDPHDARRAALDDDATRPVRADAHVVLVGAVELSALVRRALQRLASEVSALVLADEDEADAFDAFGALRPEAWCDARVPLELSRWHVTGRPAEQAATAVALARGGGRTGLPELSDARRVTIGVPWRDVVPHLERHAADLGWTARDAAGTSLLRTPPGRLLEALAEHLRTRRFETLAALFRHPDVERAAPRGPAREAGVERAPFANASPAATLDAYDDAHLPEHEPTALRLAAPDPPELEDDERARRDALAERGRNARLDGLLRWWRDALGELDERGRRPLRAWAEPLRAFLGAVYGARRGLPRPGRPLARGEAARDDEAEAYRTAGALDGLRALVDELLDVHETTSDALRLAAHEALALLLRAAAAAAVPPPPDDDALELLGPLELLLDDAERLVVTGFHEGSLPAVTRAHRLLPDGLKRALGLPDARAALAREAWALATLLRTRDTLLVTGRATARNDPLLPSRLAFHGDDAEVVARVRHLLDAKTIVPPPPDGSAAPPRELPRLPAHREASAIGVEAMSVTSFKTYLESPYRFYLQRVVRAEAGRHELELSPLHFGNIAHSVLERFGRGPLKDEADETALAEHLVGLLRGLVAERFGDETRAAVAIQVRQFAQRLELFARAQAAWRRQGWRIAHVEWAPEGGAVPFTVDGRPILLRGRIDRIDVHDVRGDWIVLDYKTGNDVPDPDKAHRDRDGRWKDLQLPLYRELARPLGYDEGRLVFGYAALPSKAEGIAVKDVRWTQADLASALETAREVVRDVRAGRFFELGDERTLAREPLQAAIAGVGLLADDEASGGDGGGEP